MNPITIEVVANGYLVRPALRDNEACGLDAFHVFETFENLVGWLGQRIQKTQPASGSADTRREGKPTMTDHELLKRAIAKLQRLQEERVQISGAVPDVEIFAILQDYHRHGGKL